MIRLPTEIKIRTSPGSNHVQVIEAFVVEVDSLRIKIPVGDDSDGNTSPGPCCMVIPRYGWNLLAGIVHDELDRGLAADRIWRLLTIELGTRAGVWFPSLRAWCGWCILAFTTVSGLRGLAVRTFEG